MIWLRQNPFLLNFIRFVYCEDVVTHKYLPFQMVPIDHFLCMYNQSGICDTKCDCLGPSATGEIPPTVLWCEGQGLQKIPDPLPSSFISMHLANNNISVLNFEKVNVLMQTTFLDLQDCLIETILPGPFINFPWLEELNLDNNLITVLKFEDFRHLKSLKILTLSRNKITQVQQHPNQFVLPILQVLSLDGNNISGLNHDIQQFLLGHQLKRLHLSGNPWACDSDTCLGLEWLVWIDEIHVILSDFNSLTCIISNQTTMQVTDLLSNPIEEYPMYKACTQEQITTLVSL